MIARERRQLPQHPIFKESIEQFGRELANFFPDKDTIPSFMIKQDEDLKDVKDQYNSEKFGIPLFTYVPDTLSPDKDIKNRGFLARNGIIIDPIIKPKKGERLDNPWLSYRVLYLTPAALNINVYYYCSYADQYEFAPMWQQAAQHRYLDFRMEIGVKTFFFKVDLSEDVTFSPLELDNNTYLKFTTSAVLHTYHGNVGTVKPATSMQINTGIIDHGDVPDKQVQPSMEITKEKSTTFKVKNRIDGETYKLED